MNQTHKKTIMDTFTFRLIKNISNFFWDIADTWSNKNKTIANYYDHSIIKSYQKEWATCGVQTPEKVLHIGCGAYPLTQLVLAQCSSATLVGIDNNPLAVQQAQDLITRYQLTSRITVHHGDGRTYPVHDFDMIIISTCATPKIPILHHVIKTMKPHSTIIIREIRIATKELLAFFDLHPEITLTAHLHHTPFPFYGPLGWDTFYLQKQ